MSLDLPLSFLERPATAGTTEPWLLVLLHGVGSNEQDLFGLTPHVPPQFHVLSLRAPYTMGPRAYAWFQFAVTPRGERSIDEAQEAASRKLLAQTVAAAAQQLDVAPGRVVVGGFSQGGIMSLSLLLTEPQLLHAAMVLHSRLLPQVLPLAAPAQALQGKQLWISHGLQDQMIPLASAHAAREHVSHLPLTLRYAEFPGGHEIRPAELQAAMQWLNEIRTVATAQR
ncbi:dienelactone hydrolase family protein [Polaromonas sp. C04]|uniref:alpha/beta hydrolase n=1 Tax=Polaromonas sp. C04 TaxID=1945857 RepID=UPI00098442DD|nr:dienelactone hydrolase family protein [Polaromonas sp. C04]OOG55706.1 phospholipase [Polaromonas sp. C04]